MEIKPRSDTLTDRQRAAIESMECDPEAQRQLAASIEAERQGLPRITSAQILADMAAKRSATRVKQQRGVA